MAFKYLRNKELADEALQAVFINLWKYRYNLNNETSIDQLLYTALKNHIIDQVNHNAARILEHYNYQESTPAESNGLQVIEFKNDPLLDKVMTMLPN